MSFNFLDQGFIAEDSYSRILDRRVARDEYPYGYSDGEPPQGYHNLGYYDERYKDQPVRPQRMDWPKEKVSVKK